MLEVPPHALRGEVYRGGAGFGNGCDGAQPSTDRHKPNPVAFRPGQSAFCSAGYIVAA